MVYALQHYRAIEYGYQIESLRSERDSLSGLNQDLRLEEASLRDPERIDGMARKMGLQSPDPGQILRMETPSDLGTPVVAQAAPVAVVSAGYAETAFRGPTRGFGFLVPRSEGLRTLGTVWNSSMFPGRAPEGHVAVATYAGGATDPEICSWPDEKLAELICGELARVMQIGAPPVTLRVQRYARALPQYNLGHGKILERLAQLAANQPGLFFAGNYWGGPSIGACVKQAQTAAAAVSNYLTSIGELTSAAPSSAPN